VASQFFRGSFPAKTTSKYRPPGLVSECIASQILALYLDTSVA
jgi:hypothetical protein